MQIDLTKTIQELIKYLCVSILAVIIDFSFYWILFTVLPISRAWAGTISYLIGLVFAYVFLKIYVFKNIPSKNIHRKEIILFFISGLIGAAITYFTILLYENIISTQSHIAKITAMGLSFIIVYIFRKIYVFKEI
jgi:putative flippase GtrA